MKRKKIAACVCVIALVASLITVYPSTVFAEERLEEMTADEMQTEENTDSGQAERIQATPSDGQEKNDGLLYVDGVAYNGYYMDKAGIMYIVSNGEAQPITKMAGKGTVYYSEAGKTRKKLPRQTLFVTGKVYTGYYMDRKNKMYHVISGRCTLKTGTVKKGTRYYSSKAKKNRKLSKQALYVKGKVYAGYYMDRKNRMCHVKSGKCTLKTGTVKKRTKYYSYKAKKSRKLSKQTLYVKGKVYSGYYMDRKNRMCHVKSGKCTLKTGMVKKGTRYYSSKAKKSRKLSKQTLYVNGAVYNGYYFGSDNRMYLLSKGTFTPVDTVLNAGTAYYSSHDNMILSLPLDKVYMDGTAVEGLTPNGIAVFQKARAIVQAVSNPADSKADKLYKCYLWIKKCPYVQYRTTLNAIKADPVDWDSTFANDIFDKGSGCCASLACAFAYMAKACGYQKVTICSDTEHAWVDIDGRLYDPLFARDRNFSLNYNAAYTDYRVHAAFTRDL